MNKECSAKTADLKRELKELRKEMKESQRLSHVGSWSWTKSDTFTWLKELYRIFRKDPGLPPLAAGRTSRGIVESANKLQLQGHPKLEAVREAAIALLRPILMTSTATIAGHFPLTPVTGAGAAALNSIGLVLMGGMFVGTFFTLFVVPSIYILIARDHAKNREREAAVTAGPPVSVQWDLSSLLMATSH